MGATPALPQLMKEVTQGGYAQFYTERPKGEYVVVVAVVVVVVVVVFTFIRHKNAVLDIT